MSDRETLLDRFCRYVRIDTQSSDASATYPSTEKQKDLLRILVEDLKAAGLADAVMDESGYVMATLPSNIPASATRRTARCRSSASSRTWTRTTRCPART